MFTTKFTQLKILGLLAITLMLSACYSDTSSSISGGYTELDRAIEQVVDQTIIPSVDSFQNASEQLYSLATRFCTTKNSENLSLLQDQWKAANEAWYRLLPFLIGPLEETDFLVTPAFWYIDSHRPRGNNNSATVRTDIDTMLADNKNITAAVFSSKSFEEVGLLALEITIFETAANEDQDNATILAEFITTDRKCEILTAHSAELLRRVDLVQAGWKNNYRDTGKSYRDLLVNKKLESTFTAGDPDSTGTPAFSRIVVSVQGYYDYLGKRNVTSNSANIAQSIWPALSQSAIITRELLTGTNNTTLSLYQLMNNGYQPDVAAIKANIDTFESTINDNNTTDMKAAAKVLDGNFKREIPDALNIALGINFSDGD